MRNVKRKVLRLRKSVEGYSVFLKDTEGFKIRKAYGRLRHKLSLKQNRLSHEALIQALDSAADDYVLANDLYLIARDAKDKFELKCEIRMAELTSEAQSSLEKDKKAKKITSQITQSLTRSWIIRHNKIEVRDLENERRELDIVKRRMEILKEAWKQRMSSLQSQARSVEQVRMIKLGRGSEKESEKEKD